MDVPVETANTELPIKALILPEVLQVIVKQLDDRSLAKIKLFSPKLRDVISKIQNSTYWWKKVLSACGIALEFNDSTDWFKMYAECVYGRGKLFAIGLLLSLEQITTDLNNRIIKVEEI